MFKLIKPNPSNNPSPGQPPLLPGPSGIPRWAHVPKSLARAWRKRGKNPCKPYKKGVRQSGRMPQTCWMPLTRKSITVTERTPDGGTKKRRVTGDFRMFKSGAVYQVMPSGAWVRLV